MRFGSFQIWKCHEQIDSRGSTEFDSQDVDKIVKTIKIEARRNLDTLRALFDADRRRMQEFDTKVEHYFDEVYDNVAQTNTTADRINTTVGDITTRADHIQIAINLLLEKQRLMMLQNQQMEQKINVNDTFYNVAEIHTNVEGLTTKADQFQIAINNLIEKQNAFEVMMSSMLLQNQRIEQKIESLAPAEGRDMKKKRKSCES